MEMKGKDSSPEPGNGWANEKPEIQSRDLRRQSRGLALKRTCIHVIEVLVLGLHNPAPLINITSLHLYFVYKERHIKLNQDDLFYNYNRVISTVADA